MKKIVITTILMGIIGISNLNADTGFENLKNNISTSVHNMEKPINNIGYVFTNAKISLKQTPFEKWDTGETKRYNYANVQISPKQTPMIKW